MGCVGKKGEKNKVGKIMYKWIIAKQSICREMRLRKGKWRHYEATRKSLGEALMFVAEMYFDYWEFLCHRVHYFEEKIRQVGF